MITITTIKELSECYPEPVEGTADWYFCKQGRDSMCDLYEAEEIVNSGSLFSGMICCLLHYPEGTVHSPFEIQENVYVEEPVWNEGIFYYLAVNFNERKIRIYSYDPEREVLKELACLPLAVAKDCYNLKLKIWPLMLCRDGNEGILELLWPEKKNFQMGQTEAFLFRDGANMYFSQWEEKPHYREYIIVRDFSTGNIKEQAPGYLCRLPGGVYWRL